MTNRTEQVRWEESSLDKVLGREIADYIVYCQRIEDMKPNAMEIAENLGERHESVLGYLRIMEGRGLVERDGKTYEHAHPQERPFMVRYGLRK